MKIPQEIDSLRDAALNALKPLMEKFDIDIFFKTMRFEPDGSAVQSTIVFKNKTLNGIPLEQIEFEKNCEEFGFKAEDYLMKLRDEKTNFELYGFNPRAPKQSCKIRDINNKEFRYRASVNNVKAMVKQLERYGKQGA